MQNDSSAATQTAEIGSGKLEKIVGNILASIAGLLLLAYFAPIVAAHFRVSTWAIVIGSIIVLQLTAILYFLRRIARALEGRDKRS